MKIGLMSDSMNFPSLPLMKLSAYHKKQGDEVTLIEEGNYIYPEFDILYVSKTFNLPDLKQPKIPDLKTLPQAKEYIFGGAGYAITIKGGREVYKKIKDKDLPSEVEHSFPDYGLFGIKHQAYGFLTRGCPNNCGFCIVTKKEGRCSKRVADLSGWWNGQKEVVLMDPNLLACKDRESLINQLIKSKAKVDFTQGLDARFMDKDTAQLVNKCDIKTIHFAFDLMKNERNICKGLENFKKASQLRDRETKVYILTNYDTTHAEDWYRVRKVIELGYAPDIRIYRKGTQPQFLTDLQNWANNPKLYRTCEFKDFVPRVDGLTCKKMYAKVLR